jgi:hypothetical protein
MADFGPQRKVKACSALDSHPYDQRVEDALTALRQLTGT